MLGKGQCKIIWANYSVSSYLKFIPICWNVLICLKYDFMHIFMHHLSLYFETTAQIPEVEYGGQIKNICKWNKDLRIYFRNLSVHRSFLQYKSKCLEKVNVKYVIKRLWHEIYNQYSLLAIIGYAKTYILQQNMW
jgi:hypothetical protein